MNRDLRRRLDVQVDGRLNDLRRNTEGLSLDVAFVDRVMVAVGGADADFVWLGAEATRRSLWVCGALVAVALVWALQAQGLAASAVLAATAPQEGMW